MKQQQWVFMSTSKALLKMTEERATRTLFSTFSTQARCVTVELNFQYWLQKNCNSIFILFENDKSSSVFRPWLDSLNLQIKHFHSFSFTPQTEPKIVTMSFCKHKKTKCTKKSVKCQPNYQVQCSAPGKKDLSTTLGRSSVLFQRRNRYVILTHQHSGIQNKLTTYYKTRNL